MGVMLRGRLPDDPPRLLRLRHTDEWVGLLVLLAFGLFFSAVFEAGVLKRWLRPDLELRIVLPQTGFGGLAVGADIDVLGTRAGSVKQIVLNPIGEIYALATIDRQTEDFIKRDSTATIRLRYGVAGAAYVDIGRGTLVPMDWNFAVLTATAEPNPADTITATLNKVTADVVPTLEHTLHAMAELDGIVSGIKAGQGSAGRLVADDTLIHQAEDTMGTLKTDAAELHTPFEVLPGLLNQSRGVLANTYAISRDLERATLQLPALAHNLTDSTANLPALLTQAQVMTAELSKFLVQLRGSFLLGGGGAAEPAPLRLPPRDVRP